MNFKAILRNTLAVIVGLIIGSIVNMGIVIFGGKLIPPPEGVDVTSMETLAKHIHLFEPIHFVAPFLAHALGTLFGAIAAAWLAVSHPGKMAFVVGVLFLLGGISNVILLPSPLWFNILDVVAAYLPMSYLAYIIFTNKMSSDAKAV